MIVQIIRHVDNSSDKCTFVILLSINCVYSSFLDMKSTMFFRLDTAFSQRLCYVHNKSFFSLKYDVFVVKKNVDNTNSGSHCRIKHLRFSTDI